MRLDILKEIEAGRSLLKPVILKHSSLTKKDLAAVCIVCSIIHPLLFNFLFGWFGALYSYRFAYRNDDHMKSDVFWFFFVHSILYFSMVLLALYALVGF